MTTSIRGNTSATILIQRAKDKMHSDIRAALTEELRAIADVIDSDPDAEAKLSKALSEASVAISVYESKLGTLKLCVSQHQANYEKELKRNQELAERITDYDTELHAERMMVKNLSMLIKEKDARIKELEEALARVQ